jgi:hypothetical protein
LYLIPQQFLQCMASGVSDIFTSDGSINTNQIVLRCISPDQEDDENFMDDASDNAFSAVSKFSNKAASIGVGGVGVIVDQIFSVPGVRNKLSGGVITEPTRLEGFTDENGEARIDFGIVSGKSGYYGVVFQSGNVLSFFLQEIYFKNVVTKVAVSDSRILRRSSATLDNAVTVFLPSFEQQTTFEALVDIREGNVADNLILRPSL